MPWRLWVRSCFYFHIFICVVACLLVCCCCWWCYSLVSRCACETPTYSPHALCWPPCSSRKTPVNQCFHKIYINLHSWLRAATERRPVHLHLHYIYVCFERVSNSKSITEKLPNHPCPRNGNNPHQRPAARIYTKYRKHSPHIRICITHTQRETRAFIHISRLLQIEDDITWCYPRMGNTPIWWHETRWFSNACTAYILLSFFVVVLSEMNIIWYGTATATSTQQIQLTHERERARKKCMELLANYLIGSNFERFSIFLLANGFELFRCLKLVWWFDSIDPFL